MGRRRASILCAALLVLAVVAPCRIAEAATAQYPVKPEAPTAPRSGSFSSAATAAARTRLRGKGIYLCNEVVGIDSPGCAGGRPRSDDEIVSIARDRMGVRQLWVRCGDSRRGFPSAAVAALDRLRAKANAAGMTVVCWDVPNFWDVPADARRLAEMSRHSDAVAVDLESGVDTIALNGYTSGGGYAGPELLTSKGRRWAAAYAGWVRHYLGDDGYPLIAVTMQPQTHPDYPFEELAASFNVISPMLYRGVTWFNGANPALGETVRAGNPFVQRAIEELWRSGVDPSRHDVVVSGMAYTESGVTAHENQLAFDIAETRRLGGIGFAGFVFESVVANPTWARAMAETSIGDGSRPSIEVAASGALAMVGNVSGTLGHWWQFSPGSLWSQRTTLAAGLASDPELTRRTDGRLAIAGRDSSGGLRYWRQTSPGGLWDDGVGLGGPIVGTPAVVEVGGKQAAVARSPSGDLLHWWETASGWVGPVVVGQGVTGDPAMAVRSDGTMVAFAQTRDGSLQLWGQRSAGGLWLDHRDLGRRIVGRPAVTTAVNDRLVIFAQGVDGRLDHWWESSASDRTWNWASLGGWPAGDPATTVAFNGALVVFARSRTGGLAHWWQHAPLAYWHTSVQLAPSGVDGAVDIVRAFNGALAIFAGGPGRINHWGRRSAGSSDYLGPLAFS